MLVWHESHIIALSYWTLRFGAKACFPGCRLLACMAVTAPVLSPVVYRPNATQGESLRMLVPP